MNNWNFLNYNEDLKTTLENFKQAATIHKKVKNDIQEMINSKKVLNMKYFDIANHIEGLIKTHSNFDKNNKFKSGIGFPIGLSINECAAHWTPNPGEDRIWKQQDLVKIDYGVHVNGCIIDSAFTTSLSNDYNQLIEISKKSTQLAIDNCGVDAVLGDIGEIVEEYIESQEVEIRGKICPLKSTKDLTGHLIFPYLIHGPKSIPNFKIKYPVRMEENEFYAVETFPTTGNGRTNMDLECSHYMINSDRIVKNLDKEEKLPKRENYLFKKLKETRQTLPFCRKWLKNEGIKGYQIPLKNLVQMGIVNSYPPLMSQKDTFVAQHEHTIFIGKDKVHNLSV
tara:strand:+ start:3101 stop:4114 length:1014 start_codon:yes stop_codon:yes gene_type:complete